MEAFDSVSGERPPAGRRFEEALPKSSSLLGSALGQMGEVELGFDLEAVEIELATAGEAVGLDFALAHPTVDGGWGDVEDECQGDYVEYVFVGVQNNNFNN